MEGLFSGQTLIDFSDCKDSGILYMGSEKKRGIIYHDQAYTLKFPKYFNQRKNYNHISEYVASHLMDMAGLDVHETILGTFNGEEVVAVRDFVAGTDYNLVEFAATSDSSYDTERNAHTAYTYDEILYLIGQHTKVKNKQEVVERFWDMFIMDALLANFDRHGYNWGFLKNQKEYRLAPIYDNGSSLFPRLSDEDLDRILNSKEEMEKRTYLFPKSQIKLDGEKSSYFQVINSHLYRECDNAACRIFSILDFCKVEKFLENLPIVSEKRKQFYKVMIEYRYEHIFGQGYREGMLL